MTATNTDDTKWLSKEGFFDGGLLQERHPGGGGGGRRNAPSSFEEEEDEEDFHDRQCDRHFEVNESDDRPSPGTPGAWAQHQIRGPLGCQARQEIQRAENTRLPRLSTRWGNDWAMRPGDSCLGDSFDETVSI